MKKNIRCRMGTLLMTLVLINVVFVSAVNAQISEEVGNNTEYNNFGVEKEYGELFLKELGYSASLVSPIPLKNMEDNIEAVAFVVNSEGYIIINVNDLSVPEFSMTEKIPFDTSKCYYYNGPLAYVEVKEDMSKAEYIYKKGKVNTSKRLLELKSASTKISSTEVRSSTSGSLSHSLRTWEDNNILCGPIAAGITLMYFDDYHDDDFVDSGNENKDDLLDLIIDEYIPNQATGTSVVRDGLDDYLEDQDLLGDYDAKSSSYFNYNKIVSLINSDKPVIIDTDNHPTYQEHWLIAHAYYILTVPYVDPQYYIVVNNGWGQNNVNVLVDDYLDDLVYIE